MGRRRRKMSRWRRRIYSSILGYLIELWLEID
jgi:hypothetical protein